MGDVDLDPCGTPAVEAGQWVRELQGLAAEVQAVVRQLNSTMAPDWQSGAATRFRADMAGLDSSVRACAEQLTTTASLARTYARELEAAEAMRRSGAG